MLPNPGMSFSPFAILTAEEMNDIVANIEALSDGSGIAAGAINTTAIADGAISNVKLKTGAGEPGGAWNAWTPALTNFTGTVNVARYKIVGKTCFFYIKVTQGASVSGQHIFSLPVAMNSNLAIAAPINTIARGWIQDLGVAQYPAEGIYISSTTIGLLTLSAASTYVQPTATSPTIPMTWANAQDSFLLEGFYEIA